MLQETELHPHSFSVSSIQDLAGPGKEPSRHAVGDQGVPSFVYQEYKGSANLPPLIGTAAEGESCFGVPEAA